MFCNRCGNQVDPNSQFCITCGNAIPKTVVPQSDGTVVPTNGTVVPTVVPQNNKSNVTITSIIVVLVLFIGAGVVGIMLLKNSKVTMAVPNQTSQIALADELTTTIAPTAKKTTKGGGWASTTTTTRVDGIENSYTVNGLKINIPDGYTPSYTNEVLTLIAPNGKDYYLVNVISTIFETIDQNKYKNELLNSGYDIHTFESGTYAGRSGMKMTLQYNGFEYQCYVVKANSYKTAFFLFDAKASSSYVDEIINYSLM